MQTWNILAQKAFKHLYIFKKDWWCTHLLLYNLKWIFEQYLTQMFKTVMENNFKYDTKMEDKKLRGTIRLICEGYALITTEMTFSLQN